jgi:hypothetical protein
MPVPPRINFGLGRTPTKETGFFIESMGCNEVLLDKNPVSGHLYVSPECVDIDTIETLFSEPLRVGKRHDYPAVDIHLATIQIAQIYLDILTPK